MRLNLLKVNKINCCSYIEELRLLVIKEKQIYTTMNLLHYNSKILQGKLWAPSQMQTIINYTLQQVAIKKPNIPRGQLQKIAPEFNQTPPTYIKTNQFTQVFQLIVNTYGVPRYREINPGIFTIITFPFLFGVMFGDIGHGFVLFLFGLHLTINVETLKNNPNSLLYGIIKYRYILLLMGFFSFFCGILYNDFTSFSLNLFGSCYQPQELPFITEGDGRENPKCVYPFGIDPIWSIS